MIKILRINDVTAVTGLARSTIYLKVSQGDFPQQVKLGPRATGWVESEVQEWIAGCVSARTVTNRDGGAYV